MVKIINAKECSHVRGYGYIPNVKVDTISEFPKHSESKKAKFRTLAELHADLKRFKESGKK